MLKSGFLYWISLKATQVFTTATWLTELCATSKAFRFFVKPGVWYSNLKLVLCLYWMKSCLAASCESVGIYVELEIIQVLVSLASARTCRDQKMTIIPHKKKRQSLISPTKNVNEGIEFQHIWVIFNVRMNVGRSCVSLSDMGDAKDGVNDTAWWWLAISSFCLTSNQFGCRIDSLWSLLTYALPGAKPAWQLHPPRDCKIPKSRDLWQHFL